MSKEANCDIYSKAPPGSTLNNTLPNPLHMLSSSLAFNFLPFIQFIFFGNRGKCVHKCAFVCGVVHFQRCEPTLSEANFLRNTDAAPRRGCSRCYARSCSPRRLMLNLACSFTRCPLKLLHLDMQLQSVAHTTASSLVNRGVFALLQHWLAACQCPVTWYHTDGHVSETQTTRRAATRSQQTHTDTQLRPLRARGREKN